MEEGINRAEIAGDSPGGKAGSTGGKEGSAGGKEGSAGGAMGAEAGFLAQIKACFPGKQADLRAYSPLALAYIGDGVYDLIIRTVVVERANRPANELHRLTVRYVSAGAQSKIAEALMDRFTEEERAVYRRGRNSKPHTTAKNASVRDYMQATGFEAVLGYLYLAGNMPRLLELVKEGIALADVDDNLFFGG